MPRILALLLVIATATPLSAQTQLPPAASNKVDYEKDVRPLLAENCYSCHGVDVQQSGLRLDLRQNALRGGDYGPVIVPGNSAESKLIKRLVNGDGGMQMPPTGALSAEQIGILRAWIDQGPEFRTEIAEAPPRPVDPKVAAFVAAVRTERRAAVEKLISAAPEMVMSRDAAGSTPLHHAVAFGTLETVTLLLDAKADVNATNRRGAMPLHWAVHDEAKVRLLLARGAQVNVRQVDGRTPLFLAASFGNALATVKLLLEHGADPSITTATGRTPLMAVAARGDVEAMRLLIEKKAAVNARNGAGETALLLAAANGSPQAVAFLLEQGADARTRTKLNETALGAAATAGAEEIVKLLLEHGAEVNVRNIRGYSPLMLAASSDTMPAGVVKLLLAHGADASYTGDYNETARDMAAKRGNTAAARALGAEAKTPAATPVASHLPVSGAVISRAVTRAFDLLDKQSRNFIRTAGCNSCHSQDLVSAAAAVARSRGLAAPASIAQLPQNMMPPPERLIELNIVAATGVMWELFDFGMNGTPRNQYTDAAARLIKHMQLPEGHWNSNESRRPPMNAGDFQAAALGLYAVKHYAPPAEQDSTNQAVAKAAAWLERTNAETTQDRAFQALGLAWSGSRAESAKKAARALIAMQRSDGGWSQLSTLESDAYATGQALYALSVAGGMSPSDPVYQKGVAYLLRTQAADGTWHVKSRSIWLQPYFESGFPYGQDQFISTAGTAWASMALSLAVEPSRTTIR